MPFKTLNENENKDLTYNFHSIFPFVSLKRTNISIIFPATFIDVVKPLEISNDITKLNHFTAI